MIFYHSNPSKWLIIDQKPTQSKSARFIASLHLDVKSGRPSLHLSASTSSSAHDSMDHPSIHPSPHNRSETSQRPFSTHFPLPSVPFPPSPPHHSPCHGRCGASPPVKRMDGLSFGCIIWKGRKLPIYLLLGKILLEMFFRTSHLLCDRSLEVTTTVVSIAYFCNPDEWWFFKIRRNLI